MTIFKKLDERASKAQSQIYRYTVSDLDTGEEAHTDDLQEAHQLDRHILIWDDQENQEAQ